jgi:DNA-directed RNA polymerase specialized sigma24 family protein
MPSAPSPGGGDITEALIDRHAQLVQQYQEQLARLDEEQLAIETAIASLEDPTARRLLRYRYIDGLKWEEICVLIKYEWSRTHDLHSMALQQLKEQEKPEA